MKIWNTTFRREVWSSICVCAWWVGPVWRSFPTSSWLLQPRVSSSEPWFPKPCLGRPRSSSKTLKSQTLQKNYIDWERRKGIDGENWRIWKRRWWMVPNRAENLVQMENVDRESWNDDEMKPLFYVMLIEVWY